MEAVLLALAVAGFLAVLRGVLRAALRLAGRAAEAYVTREVARTRARHGDVTGLSEARVAEGRARGARLRAGAALALWTALLVAPALTPWTTPAYAACSLVWAHHWSRKRRRPPT